MVLPVKGTVFCSVANRDKRAMIFPVKRLAELGFTVYATEGTAESAAEWLELGARLEVEAPAQARRAYARVLEMEPAHAEALVNLGRLLHEEGELEEAVALYRRALEAGGGDQATAAFNLGIALEDLDRDDEAATAYRRAIDADHGFADAHYNLARVLERQGDKVSALRHLKSYRALTRPRR